ncbi:hypothetical protein C1H46_029564 [Malus baccata]|uniref:CCHC-type domain-containing protein n=1 Tax=Malus baccata TaxID=106549 RepID=A0A540LEK3_MALBA|nr:hypothetical protein C1H46_029564 [Malus baccata]
MAAMYVQGNQSKSGNQTDGYSQGESSSSSIVSRVADGQWYQGNNTSYNNKNDYNSSQNYNRNSYGGYGSFNNSRPYQGNRQRRVNNYIGSWNSWNGNSWNGNTSFRSGAVVECQICSRMGHTAPNCLNRSDNGSYSNGYQITICQICGKKWHSALECRHKNNYAYQGAPPPPSLTAFSTQAPSHMSAAEFGHNA